MPFKTKCDAEVRLLLVSATTEHDRDMVRLLKGMSLIHADTFYEIYRNILEMDDNETSVRVARLLCQNFARQLAREKNPRNRHHQDSEEVDTQEEEETSEEEEEEEDDEEEEEPLPLPLPRDEGILAGGKNRRPVYLKNEYKKRVIHCILRECEYDPETRQISQSPQDMMTPGLKKAVLGDAASNPMERYKVDEYISSLSKRLSSTSPAEMTTFYDEYLSVYGGEDPYNLLGCHQHAEASSEKTAVVTPEPKGRTRSRIPQENATPARGGRRSRVPESERLEHLTAWVEQKKQEAQWSDADGSVFECPRPRYRPSVLNIESRLGCWINGKISMARNGKTDAKQHASDMLNGPVAQILGREEGWWLQSTVGRPSKRGRATKAADSDQPVLRKRRDTSREDLSSELEDED